MPTNNNSVPNTAPMSDFHEWAQIVAQQITASEMRGDLMDIPDFEMLYQIEREKNNNLIRNHALFSKFLTQVMPDMMNEDDSWEYLEGMIAEGLLPDPRTSKISVSLNLGCDQRLHLVVPYTYDTNGEVHQGILEQINRWLKKKMMINQQAIDGTIEELVAIFAVNGIEARTVAGSYKTNNVAYMYSDNS